MSLFDIIKYPIDIRFRLEDLERIPSNILDEWWKELCESYKDTCLLSTFFKIEEYGNTVDRMTFYVSGVNENYWNEYALKALQRRIQEHDLQP